MTLDTFYIPAIIAIAMLFRSIFGFGDSLIALPLLAALSTVKAGVPVLAAVGSTMTLYICISEFRQIDWRHIKALLISCLLGLPFGVTILVAVPEAIAFLLLGFVVVLFSLYNIAFRQRRLLVPEAAAWGFGFAGGVLGGAFNLFGLPVAIYGGLRQWSPSEFRLLLSSFFLPSGLLGVFLHWSAGLWGPDFVGQYLWSLPLAVLATWLGKRINYAMKPDRFTGLIWWVIGLSGLMIFGRGLIEVLPGS